MTELATLQERLGYQFREEGLLRLALTHPSVAHENPGGLPHNQRLEFLGDAVLSLVLTRELYDRFPNLGEGPLTKARAYLVNRRALAAQARQLGLGEHLVLSHGEETTGGRQRPSALADAYEALLGAMFIDGGFEAARAFILRRFFDSVAQVTQAPLLDNPKGDLQEMLQEKSAEAPQYEVTAVSGPDHDRLFECSVHHGGVELGRGQGKSKKAAESSAAMAALKALREKQAPPAEEKPPTAPSAEQGGLEPAPNG